MLENVHALAELERLDWNFEIIGDDEVRLKCPAHNDHTPSLSLNTKKNIYYCHTCKEGGDIVTLLALILKLERTTVLSDLGQRYDLEEVKILSPKMAEKFHKRIFQAGPLLQKLRDRGVTDEMIRYARLGFSDGRITIPVYDIKKNIVNIRRYLPGAPGAQKFRNTKGFGKSRIYQLEDLKHDRIIITGGEIKALVAGFHSRPEKIGCVAATGGEGSWDNEWNQQLRNKIIYICMDIDIAGRVAAKKLGTSLQKIAKELYLMRIPLDKEKYPKGDINDFFFQGGKFEDLIAVAEPFRIEAPTDPLTTELTEVSLFNARSAKYVRRKITFEGVVSAADQTPYIVPKVIRVLCDRKQANCGICPVYAMEEAEYVDMTIPPTSDGILSMVDSTKKLMGMLVLESLGIPKCKSVKVFPTQHYNVTDVRLAPQLTLSNDGTKNITQPAMIVGQDIELNVPYNLAGILYPHPKNQQAVLMIDEAEESCDSLDSFVSSNLIDLKLFQPEEWTENSVRKKLNQIYKDLEANVTRIFYRRELHLIIDLTYHSVMLFNFDDREVTGWVNSLIMGDSSQGKSETTIRLKEHYGLGERVECKNASVAGLLGGLQQLGNRWFVSWGIIPQHDRRLVVLEEVKGASPEVIGKLTDMRSSGIAEIPKIERRRAYARTRLIFISNPRSSRPIGAFGFGIEAIRELIGSLEDIRRFDVAVILAEEQVEEEKISKRPKVKHEFTKEMCRKLILFAWTRKPNQINFNEEVTNCIFEEASKLCGAYSELIPLIDKGTMKYKLARLSIAMAIRTASIEKEDVIVRPCHVRVVSSYLDKVYSDKFFGYKEFSNIQKDANEILDEGTIQHRIRGSKFPKDLVQQMLAKENIEKEDFQDWCEVDMDEARGLISFFVRKHCLIRSRQGYYKTPGFIQLLKKLEVQEQAEVFDGEEL